MGNVVLVTTMWEDVNPVEAIARETELCGTESFWGTMLASGASTQRYNNQRVIALEIIKAVVKKSPAALRIQKELVDDGAALVDTDAGAYVNEELIKLQRKHKEELEAVREEMNRAIKSSMLSYVPGL